MTSKNERMENLLEEIGNTFEQYKIEVNGKTEQRGLYANYSSTENGYEMHLVITFEGEDEIDFYESKIKVTEKEGKKRSYWEMNIEGTSNTLGILQNILINYFGRPNQKTKKNGQMEYIYVSRKNKTIPKEIRVHKKIKEMMIGSITVDKRVNKKIANFIRKYMRNHNEGLTFSKGSIEDPDGKKPVIKDNLYDIFLEAGLIKNPGDKDGGKDE